MLKTSCFLIIGAIVLLVGCQKAQFGLSQWGKHYQQYKDFESLNKVIAHLPPDADTTLLKSILGEPIDMGFDYRYLLDSTGENGCVIGAVFHLDGQGKFDQKWIGEICE